MIIQALFHRKHRPSSAPSARGDIDARKMTEAKQQNERAYEVADGVNDASNEFARIVSRVKRDDPLILPGPHRAAGGFR